MVSGEVKSPRRVMPRAFKTTVYRIFGFYLTGALCVGIVAASDDPNLLGAIADGAAGAAKSPYVICEFYNSHPTRPPFHRCLPEPNLTCIMVISDSSDACVA